MRIYFYVFLTMAPLLASGLLGCSRPPRNETSTTSAPTPAAADPEEEREDNLGGKSVTVYKSPTCGCCTKWEEHLMKAGFKVTSKTVDNMDEIRKRFAVPNSLESCHTGVIDGYVIEGHVPADDVKRLLATRPDGVVGLAAPGMPANSPGMQPEGEKPSGYDVLSFDRNGASKVFTTYK